MNLKTCIPIRVQVPAFPNFDLTNQGSGLEVGLIKRDARAVSAIRAGAGVNGQGVGEHLHPYHNGLESAEKENTRSRPCSQSKSRPAQRVGVVSESALGMQMELEVILLLMARE
jgi:hypothetical protein